MFLVLRKMMQRARRFLSNSVYLLIVAAFLSPTGSLAQVSFSTPNGGSSPIAHCKDYFSYEWNTPLDMSGKDNGPLNYVPKNDVRDLDGFSYSGGLLSFTSTATSPTLTLVSSLPPDPSTGKNGAVPIGSRYGERHPIDSSTYHLLVLRINSSRDTTAQILWGKNSVGRAVAPFDILQGWHTYVVDMNSVSVGVLSGSVASWSASPWEELVLIPTNSSGVSMSVDFIELLSDTGCGSGSISFNATAQGAEDRYAVVLDTDGDPTNGVEYSATGAAGNGISKTIGPVGANFPIQSLNPGSHSVYGLMSGDWATLEMINPWDFASSDDIRSNTTYGISGATVAGGSFSGTVSTGDPSFYLNMRGKTIDAAVFRVVSVGATYSFPVGTAFNSLDMFFFNSSNQLLGLKHISSATAAGSHVYNVTLGPADGWSGQIAAIRIDPTNNDNGIGTTFSIDYVALRDAGTVNSLTLPAVTSAPASLEINNPQLVFIQPDQRGGRDYAQTVLGNSWNMNTGDDISRVINSSAAQVFPNNALTDELGNVVIGDFFRADNKVGNGDPSYPLLSNAPVDTRINTEDFMNICFRGWNQTDSSGYNSVARVLYHDPSIANERDSYKDGDDIIMNKGVQEYCLDLSSTLDSRTEPNQAAGAPNPWTAVSASHGSGVDVLRVDMNEVEEGVFSIIDFVHLRTDHESNSLYAITVSTPLDQAVALYYKPASGGSETLIGTLAAGRNTNIYKWNTSGVAPDRYNIIGKIVQNGNTFVQQAPGRISINHSRDQDTTAPILSCERPSNGYEFDPTFEIAGYALDETRLAAVEVFVDGNWFASVTPDRFHLAARDAYATYAESNNPGFQQLLDASAISYGAHTISLTAVDTGGNETSCSYSVSRRVGANPSPLTYPDNNASPVSVPLYIPRTPATPRVAVKLQAKSKVSYKITGTSDCAEVTLYAGSDSKLSNAVVLLRTTGAASTTASSTKVPTFSKSKKSKDDGLLYLMARCDTGEVSRKTALDTRKTKNKKKSTSEKKLLVYLRSHTKLGS